MRSLRLLLAGLALSAGHAVAQRPPDTHGGVWFSGGLGGGWMEDVRGGAAYLRNVTATALLYPFYETTGVPGHDLFFKGGFGVAATSGTDAGVGMTFGSGYDFRLSSNFYVTPNVDYLVMFLGGRTDTTILFTLGLGFH